MNAERRRIERKMKIIKLTGRNAEDLAGGTDFLVDLFHDQTENRSQSLGRVGIAVGPIAAAATVAVAAGRRRFLRFDAQHLLLLLLLWQSCDGRSDLIEELQMAALLVIVGGRAEALAQQGVTLAAGLFLLDDDGLTDVLLMADGAAGRLQTLLDVAAVVIERVVVEQFLQRRIGHRFVHLVASDRLALDDQRRRPVVIIIRPVRRRRVIPRRERRRRRHRLTAGRSVRHFQERSGILLLMDLVSVVKIRQCCGHRCLMVDGGTGIERLLHQRLRESGAARHQLSHLLAVNIPYKANNQFLHNQIDQN